MTYGDIAPVRLRTVSCWIYTTKADIITEVVQVARSPCAALIIVLSRSTPTAYTALLFTWDLADPNEALGDAVACGMLPLVGRPTGITGVAHALATKRPAARKVKYVMLVE
jgi:hypothetical protein